MPVFNYKARAANGSLEEGALTATTREGALRELTDAGVFPTQLGEAQAPAPAAERA